MAVVPNIKLDTSMIKEFSSPVSNQENAKKYVHVNGDNQIDYLSIQEVIEEINEAGGVAGGGSGETGHSSIDEWNENNTYTEGDTVIHNNSIYKCHVESSTLGVFDILEWTLIAGYSKKSYFYYNPEQPITQIVLQEEVADKGAFNVNVNNLLLQSNNYGLESDHKTITFFEPIAPDTNVEVIVYGNMIIPTDVSNVVIKEYTAVVDGTTTFELNEIIAKKELVTVNIENQVILNNEWELDDTRTKVVLNNPVNKDTRVQISYFNNLELKLGATFTPHLERDDNITTTLSWTNDGGLVNPVDSYIYDGVTFTPAVSKTGVHTTISWSNNGEKQNPTDVIVSDGATFTPDVSKENYTTTITWSNDNGLPNPNDVTITDGVNYTPTVSKTDYTTSIVWNNDQGKENPASVNILDGIKYIPAVSKENYTTTISWSNNQGAENPQTVTVLDGIKYVPTVSKEGLNTTISWSNDQSAVNPNTVVIEDGATFTPHTTQGVHEATISFTNDKNLQNPETISVYTNYAQRIVESFTATEGQTTFVASHEIYDKSVLSVNVGNTELTAAAYSLGADKKTVTLVSGLSAGTLVDLKYFYNLNIGTEGVTFTPVLTPSANGYTISWTNDGELTNPTPVEIINGTNGTNGTNGVDGAPGAAGPAGADGTNGSTFIPSVTPIANGYTLSWTNDGGLENPASINIESGKGINPKGEWVETEAYVINDYVTFEDTTANYGYVAINTNVPAGTALTDTTYWAEMYKILKEHIAATIKDWNE